MNYYEHHIGDYDADTAHLTWLEDMAYTRMLRLYYRKEAALPVDIAAVCRLVRATTKEERKAVETVLHEFFVLQSDGWHQARCDAEVEAYQRRVERNRTVGKLGGRPRKGGAAAVPTGDALGSETETQSEPTENPVGFSWVSKNNPPQTPDPITTSTDVDVVGGARKRASHPPARPPDVDEQTWADWLALRRSKSAAVTATVLAGARAEAGLAGMPLAEFLREWCLRGSQGLKAAWLKRGGGAQPRDAPAQSFAAQDRDAAMARWEAMTGSVHPDRAPRGAPDAPGVIDVTPKTLSVETAR